MEDRYRIVIANDSKVVDTEATFQELYAQYLPPLSGLEILLDTTELNHLHLELDGGITLSIWKL